jgi:hypothetical protein
MAEGERQKNAVAQVSYKKVNLWAIMRDLRRYSLALLAISPYYVLGGTAGYSKHLWDMLYNTLKPSV